VPYEEQQLAALSFEEKGILKLSEGEMASLAARIRQRIETMSAAYR